MTTVSPVKTDPNPAFSVPLGDTLTERKAEFTNGNKRPKRVLHFSDGTLEEYSSDEEDGVETYIHKQTETQLTAVNPATLPWMPWFMHQTLYFGGKALEVCDYVGEYLAGFFGIISPKYEYEIEHYKRMLAEEKEKRKEDTELGGWSTKNNDIVASEQFRTAERFPFIYLPRWTHQVKKSIQV